MCVPQWRLRAAGLDSTRCQAEPWARSMRKWNVGVAGRCSSVPESVCVCIVRLITRFVGNYCYNPNEDGDNKQASSGQMCVELMGSGKEKERGRAGSAGREKVKIAT